MGDHGGGQNHAEAISAMTETPTFSRPLKLRSLAPERQEAVAKYCAGVSLDRGVEWLKAEFGVTVCRSWLAKWLRDRRTGVSAAAARKTRSDCKLLVLSEEQQTAVFEHCDALSFEEGAKWIAAKFGITVRPQTLGEWLRKERIHRPIREWLQSIEDDRDRATLIANVVGAAAAITEANIVLIAQAIFEQLRKPPEERDEKLLAKYMSLALKARGQNLQSRSIDLNSDKFQFDVAKRAKECAAQLQQIDSEEGDEREKIEKAIVVLFGEAPSPEEAAA